jgi:ligand-binding sensor domain-containing protein/two-component sensor histidine kinase
MKIKYFLLLYILFIGIPLHAQEYTAAVEQVTIDQGLFQGTVNCIMQDSRGFMWFGTSDGLARYDGCSFRIFSRGIPGGLSLPDNNITSITEDRKGSIWFGTGTGYICMYDPSLLRINSYKIKYHPLFKPPGELPFDVLPVHAGYTDSSITTILCDKYGVIWAGTFGSGLFRFFPEENRFIQYYYAAGENTISSDYILSLAEDKNGTLWAGTYNGGLNKLGRKIKNSGETGITFTAFYGGTSSELRGCRNITSVIIKNNLLYIASYDGGLFYYNTENTSGSEKFFKKEIRLSQEPGEQNYFTSLASGAGDDLWIGTYGSGLIKINVKAGFARSFMHNTVLSTSAGNDNIAAVTVDKTGLVWAAALNGYSINRLNERKIYFRNYNKQEFIRGTLSNNSVTAFAQDSSGNIWIGTRNGLNKYDAGKGLITAYLNDPGDSNTLSGNYITALLVDKNNLLWIGTSNSGLNTYDPVKKIFTRYRYKSRDKTGIGSDRITSLLQDKNGTIWAGTSNAGLNKISFNNNRVSFIHYMSSTLYSGTIPENSIRKVFRDSEGNVRALTRSGFICRYNYASNDFSYIKVPADDAEIISVYSAGRNIFLGTAGSGICEIDVKNNKVVNHFYSPVLQNKTIVSIAASGNDFWLGTGYGLIKYNIKDKSAVLYNTNDGLQGMKFLPEACLKASTGMMYFGGVNGFNFFQPGEYSKNENRDRVFITSFRAGDKEIPVNNRAGLADYQNSVSFEFSLTDFTDPLKNQYCYKLAGHDKEWKYTSEGNNTASYTDLPPGEYTFYVRGINSSGGKCINTASLHFTISPVFWKTWWFILLVVSAAASGTGFFVYLRINHYLAVERLKAKISADLHDSIGSGLTEIALLSDISQVEYNKLAGRPSTSLENIAARSRELVDSMSDIVWLVSPKPKSMYDLFIRLKEIYNPILSQRGVKLIVDIPGSFMHLDLSMEQRQNIYLIFKEAINNSIKYSCAKNITFTAQREENYINISLKDDGKGFDSSAGKGNGLPNMKKRAAAINASVDIISETGRGTLVALNVKL